MAAKDVRELLAPTAPVKVTVPAVPALMVNEVKPLIVLEKLIDAPAGEAPPFVLSKVGVFVIATGPVIAMVLALVVILPFTWIAVDPV